MTISILGYWPVQPYCLLANGDDCCDRRAKQVLDLVKASGQALMFALDAVDVRGELAHQAPV